MNNDKDKKQAKDTPENTQPKEREQEPNLHFDQVNDTYGSEETLESDAAAEQQRKEALTERD